MADILECAGSIADEIRKSTPQFSLHYGDEWGTDESRVELTDARARAKRDRASVDENEDARNRMRGEPERRCAVRRANSLRANRANAGRMINQTCEVTELLNHGQPLAAARRRRRARWLDSNQHTQQNRCQRGRPMNASQTRSRL